VHRVPGGIALAWWLDLSALRGNRRMDCPTQPLALWPLPLRDVGYCRDCVSGQPSPFDDLVPRHLAGDQPEERHQRYRIATCSGAGELPNGVDDDA